MAIVFTHNGTQYTLEYTRDAVRQMERSGFDLNNAGSQPMTSLMALFKGAFIAHHARISQVVVDEIWEKIENKDGLFDALITLYNETIDSLMKEPDEGEKIEWAVK